jgi:hypothetical protein
MNYQKLGHYSLDCREGHMKKNSLCVCLCVCMFATGSKEHHIYKGWPRFADSICIIHFFILKHVLKNLSL